MKAPKNLLVYLAIVAVMPELFLACSKSDTRPSDFAISDFYLDQLVSSIADSLILSPAAIEFNSIPQIDYSLNLSDYRLFRKEYATFFISNFGYIPGEPSTTILNSYASKHDPGDSFKISYGIETINEDSSSFRKTEDADTLRKRYSTWGFIANDYSEYPEVSNILRSEYQSNADFLTSLLLMYRGEQGGTHNFQFIYSIHTRELQTLALSKFIEVADSTDVVEEFRRFSTLAHGIRFRRNHIPFATHLDFDSLRSAGYQNHFARFLGL